MTRRLNSRRTRELDPRVAWLLMLLYPRAWRDRYGAEVLRLTRELVAAGETTPARAAVDLACAAVAERCRVLGNSWRPAMAMTAAVLVAVAGSAYVTGHARRAHHASTVSPVSAAPARATLAGALCSFPRPAAGAVMTGRPATVTGLVPAGPTFTLSLPAGPRVIPSPRLLVPVVRVTVKRAGCALDLAEASASRLDREQRAAIRELIQRDHAFHGKPHRRTPSR